jgi:class 3 adenylate cyclase/CheY-like chemotaxis protein
LSETVLAEGGATERATVLVVDDTPDNLMLMSELLKGEFKVRVANNGEKALEICRSRPPDLVLLDISMPGIDGYEVLRRLKLEPATRHIPVIFLTALTETENEQLGIELGAVDYISKPVSPPIVLARVRSHVALAQRSALLDQLADKLSHYLPPQVYRSIFEGRQGVEIAAQRRRLTIFFSDIKDFTETTEEMEPEDVTYLVNDYFSEMSHIALEHGATIDKFIGDAMLMFFGDPETRGEREDALQCVRMAVKMQRRMVALQQRWAARGYARPFHMRVGINTGFCNVGNFGSDSRMDYTIIGAEVNLASRLEQLAEPDGIMLSYATWALVADEFAADERPPVSVKGIARDIRCFALRDVLVDAAPDDRVFARSRPGLQLSLRPALLGPEERAAALRDLEDAMRHLRGGES